MSLSWFSFFYLLFFELLYCWKYFPVTLKITLYCLLTSYTIESVNDLNSFIFKFIK